MILDMMTIEQRIMAGEDPAKIMQEIELAKKKKAAAAEKEIARQKSEEQLKKTREKVITAIIDYMDALGFPRSILDKMIEEFTEETFKEIDLKIKLLMPLAIAMEKMDAKPKTVSRDKTATRTITKEVDADTIINDFLKSLM